MDIYRYPGHSLATARLTAIEGISPASIAVPEALDIGITGQGDSKTWTEMLELRVQRVKPGEKVKMVKHEQAAAAIVGIICCNRSKRTRTCFGKALDDRESQVKEGGTKYFDAGTASIRYVSL